MSIEAWRSPLPADCFAGRVALVTGGGSGLGQAIATHLAGLGARVAVLGRKLGPLEDTCQVIRGAGGQAMAVTGDVRDPGQVADAVNAVEERFGLVDLLVNSAAGNFIVPAENLSVNGWRAVVGIVLDGTFYCCREVGTRLIRAGRPGSFLNIVVSYAWTGNPGTVHSAAAKAGVLSLTRTLAVEWARYGLRVNALAPGPADTEGAGAHLWPTPEARQEVVRHIPAGRLARPEEVAWTASFMLSDYAAYMTGECVVLDGGQWLGQGMFPYRSGEALSRP
jgi:NAD(P)-dependent dehydrogenase (short-subunit alcohol dehydrogenase family)